MRLYMTTALCTLVALIGFFRLFTKILARSTIVIDEEQKGLKDQIVSILAI